ncbi:hypothetical protein Bpfe_016722 [Biomphalaria pfeifferi]|uniref:Uncharacterized protein n=1 Tax=Biomphalaria pfeifferi TaxID=112525 RepID=A0AAD8BHB2_BIOPF|nr:hypothetical protein Bpfe_016722 [Biomphalaria pfeifferi]
MDGASGDGAQPLEEAAQTDPPENLFAEEVPSFFIYTCYFVLTVYTVFIAYLISILAACSLGHC